MLQGRKCFYLRVTKALTGTRNSCIVVCNSFINESTLYFQHGDRSFMVDPWSYFCSSQCSTTGETKAMVCTILSVGRKEMFYLTTHSTHFIYGYMASGIWLRTILIARKETCCHHLGYSFRLTARVLLYASSHRQDSTYYGLCYTSRGALIGTRNSSMGPPHEGSIRRPIAP